MLLTRGCVAGLHVPNRSGREALCGVGDVLRKVSVDLELFRGASGGGGGGQSMNQPFGSIGKERHNKNKSRRHWSRYRGCPRSHPRPEFVSA